MLIRLDEPLDLIARPDRASMSGKTESTDGRSFSFL